MASNNPSSSNTKQITMAAFKRYVTTMKEPTSFGVNASDSDSPLASPSAITPTPLDHQEDDLWSEMAAVSPQATSRSRNDDQLRAEQVRAFESIAFELGHRVTSSDSNGDHEHVTNIVVRRLRIIGDEFDQTLNSRMWTTIVRAFRSQDGSILQQFSKTIISVKNELSLHMVVKIFYFGWRMLTMLSPLDYYSEQQYRILSVFADFLFSELSDWIEKQGGWESIISDDQLRSYSTSDIPDHQPSPPLHLPAQSPNLSQLPASIESSNTTPDQTPPLSKRSYSQNYSSRPSSNNVPIPRHKRPLTLSLSSPQTCSRREHRNESESPSSASSGSLGSVVSFGLGVSFGIALCTFFFKN